MSKTLISADKNVNNLFKALLLLKCERQTLFNLVKVYNLLGEFVGKHYIFFYYIISLKPDQGLNHLYIELSHTKNQQLNY